MAGDFNGDGETDLYVVKNGRWHVLYASGGNYSSPMDTTQPASNQTCTKTMDVDGDRRTDLLVKGTDGKWRIYRATGNSGSSAFNVWNTNIPASNCSKTYVQDVDGDGRDDLTYVPSGGAVYMRKSVGNGFSTTQNVLLNLTDSIHEIVGHPTTEVSRLVDFNGDGRGDILVRKLVSIGTPWEPILEHRWEAYVYNGAAYVLYRDLGKSYSQRRVVDLNGDGLHDIAAYNAPTGWVYLTSTGKGMIPSTQPGVGDGNYTRAVFADYDGDGRRDLIRATSSQWLVHKSTGDGFDTSAIGIGGSSPNTTQIMPMDVTGNGHLDLVLNHVNLWKIRDHNSDLADVVLRFEDGFGNFQEPTYEPLSTTSHYAQAYVGVPPETQNYQTAMHIVADYTSNDGAGGTFNNVMFYYGAMRSLKGRGFLGFRQVRRYDYRDGTRFTRDFYHQDFPYIGRLDWREVRQGDWKMIAKINPHWANTDLGNGVRFARDSLTTTHEYQVGGTTNGDWVRKIDEAMWFETTYGNMTQKVVTVTSSQSADVFTRTTNYQYANYSSNWCLGLPTQVSTTSSSPGVPTETRTVSNTYDSNTCRLTTSTNTSLNSTADRLKSTLTYDTFGNLRTVRADSANGAAADRLSETTYDAYGQFPTARIQHISGAPNPTTSWTWDYVLGLPMSETNPRGQAVSWTYDPFGRMKTESRPDGTSSSLSYTECTTALLCEVSAQYSISQSHSDGSDSRQYFDRLNRPISGWARLPTGSKSWSQITYDLRGRVERSYMPWVEDSAGHETKFYETYDYDLVDRPTLINRPISETMTSGATTAITYHGLTESVAVKSSATQTQTTVYRHDPLGRLTTMTDPAGGLTEYRYTAFGDLRETWNTLDPSETRTTMVYDALGRKVAMNLPTSTGASCNGGYGMTYSYTVFNELKSDKDSKCQSRTYAYNQLGLPTTRTEPEGTTTYNYYTNNDHRLWLPSSTLTTATNTGYWESYIYDTLSRPITSNVQIGGTTYQTTFTYHASGSGRGKLKRINYPQSTGGYRLKVDYEYDAFGQLSKVKRGDAPGTVYYELLETDAIGRERLALLGNALSEDRTYDRANGNLTRIQTGPVLGNAVQNLKYDWDYINNLTRRDDLRQSVYETFDYDSLNRLKTARLNGSGSPSLSLNYNAIGNITSKSDVGTYAYGAGSASIYSVTSVAGARPGTYAYDANGNMTSRAGNALTWFSFDKPKRINYGSDYAEFDYAPDRRRFKQVARKSGVTTTTLYIGAHFETETTGSTTQYRHNVMAGAKVVAIYTRPSSGSATTRYVHRDHLGSVESLTNETGAVVQRYSFDAFGKRRNLNWTADTTDVLLGNNYATSRGYTGHEHIDNTRLIHMNGRVQDTILGRMISADPLVTNPLLSQDFNRYSYVRNNPLSLIDPTGFSVADLWVNEHADNSEILVLLINRSYGNEPVVPDVAGTNGLVSRISSNSNETIVWYPDSPTEGLDGVQTELVEAYVDSSGKEDLLFVIAGGAIPGFDPNDPSQGADEFPDVNGPPIGAFATTIPGALVSVGGLVIEKARKADIGKRLNRALASQSKRLGVFGIAFSAAGTIEHFRNGNVPAGVFSAISTGFALAGLAPPPIGTIATLGSIGIGVLVEFGQDQIND